MTNASDGNLYGPTSVGYEPWVVEQQKLFNTLSSGILERKFIGVSFYYLKVRASRRIRIYVFH